ncbi:hypothetical protein AB8880_03345 [Alphaproteobacteria bacterium LSUCC0684]
MATPGFDTFLGIDWSGARGEYHRGIQVALAAPGHACPEILSPPARTGWSRADILTLLLDFKKEGRSVLAGIDFAFVHPMSEDGGYFPAYPASPKTPEELWQVVEHASADEAHLYGGGIWGHPELRRFYNAPRRRDGRGGRGELFSSRRRMTEIMAARVNGRSPSPTFNCVGPAGVGTGSLAGMRLLHRLKRQAWIWPILPAVQKDGAGQLAVVEIFPSLYFSMAGITDRMKRDAPLSALNRALAFYQAEPARSLAEKLPDQDDSDAMISAAALRDRHCPDQIFPIEAPARASAAQEGWIFGVGYARQDQ